MCSRWEEVGVGERNVSVRMKGLSVSADGECELGEGGRVGAGGARVGRVCVTLRGGWGGWACQSGEVGLNISVNGCWEMGVVEGRWVGWGV